MGDISHRWGADLSIGPKGDLTLAKDEELGQQRILRRLLTNPGDYIWHLDYGGGLGAFVGRTVSRNQIAAVIRGQIVKEPSVAQSPEPQVVIDLSRSVEDGTIFVELRYTNAPSQDSQLLRFVLPGAQ
jgi:hypothetical protein